MGNNLSMHDFVAGFEGRKIVFSRGSEKQKLANFATCFPSLPSFQKMFKWLFLKLDIMFNIFQFEISKLKFI